MTGLGEREQQEVEGEEGVPFARMRVSPCWRTAIASRPKVGAWVADPATDGRAATARSAMASTWLAPVPAACSSASACAVSTRSSALVMWAG